MERLTNLWIQLDKITSTYRNLLNSTCEEQFLRYLSNEETLRLHWLTTENECRQLKEKLDSVVKDISVLENKLHLAAQWINEEKTQRMKVTREKDVLFQQLNAVRQILLKDYFSELPEDTKKELIFFEPTTSDYEDAGLGSPQEHSSSDDKLISAVLGATRGTPSNQDVGDHDDDDDDDDDGVLALPTESIRAEYSSFVKDLKKQDAPNIMRKIENGFVVTGTEKQDLTIPNHHFFKKALTKSPKRFTPKINHDFVKKELENSLTIERSKEKFITNRVNLSRHHNFISRTFLMPESCSRCYRKIAFGRAVFKCTDCAIVIHPECRDDILSTCKSYLKSTRIRKMGSLSDYVHQFLPPFIPSLVFDCVKEIERQGLHEQKLYRTPGTKSLVNRLLEDIHYNKELQSNLIDCDIHSICGALMTFFESLKEPLIPHANVKTFTDAVTNSNKGDCDLMLAISTLPHINRDTLAFLVLHLQNVILESSSSVEDLAVVFSSIIFGSHGRELDHAHSVVQELILLPQAYWNRLISASLLLSSTPSKSDYAEKVSVYFSRMTATPSPNKRKRFFDTDPPIRCKYCSSDF